jgi:hypothetical protein
VVLLQSSSHHILKNLFKSAQSADSRSAFIRVAKRSMKTLEVTVKLKWLIPLSLLMILVLAACARGEPEADVAAPTPAATEEAEVAPTETPTPELTPTPAESPVETPSAVDEALETPTPAAEEEASAAEPVVELTPCAEELSEQDALLAAQIPAAGCPVGSVERVYMARQAFQQGQMIWSDDTETIYVLSNDGSWRSYDDAFEEGEPEDDPGLTPPPNLLQPIRGFGLIWREELGGAGAETGWATSPEAGVNGSVQQWDNGLLITFDLQNRFLLLDDGRWERV